ncbi:HEPN domain-containing protein [uncultured Hyphomicrobium sp.]|uniref:HEPN domain-containing protein n=1 Tax=uncultured Hyphomicrobium sp. TaxID=194373 RepID=UPI0025E992A8|nr:HEPN domain-containing protein [uncultured Hyphomicrobium sp.]
MDSIHPEARRNINERALALLETFRRYKPPPTGKPKFPSERIPAAVLADDDFIDVRILTVADPYGRTLAKFYHHGSAMVGLKEEDYPDLSKIVGALQKVAALRNRLSETFLEDHVFLWCRGRLRDGYTGTLIDYLEMQISADVHPRTVWAPISSLEVEHEFTIGDSRICPITAQFLNDLELRSEGAVAPEDREHSRAYFQSLRQKMQGHAAVVVETDAEPVRAFELAMAKAEAAIGILRLFSQAALDPGLICPCALLGTEHLPIARAVLVANGQFAGARSQSASKSMGHWRLDADLIREIKGAGLDDTAALIKLQKPTAFQTVVLASHLRYSKSTMVDDLGDRLVYMLTALESLYLKDGSEQIGQNLGERLAFTTAHTADEREKVIRNVKAIYKFRSNYLHHGATISERHEIGDFMMTAYNGLEVARRNNENFPSVEEFCSAVDRYKLGGVRPFRG